MKLITNLGYHLMYLNLLFPIFELDLANLFAMKPCSIHHEIYFVVMIYPGFFPFI